MWNNSTIWFYKGVAAKKSNIIIGNQMLEMAYAKADVVKDKMMLKIKDKMMPNIKDYMM